MQRGEQPLKPLKFVHMADVHLDTGFYSKDENTGRKLRDALRQAFRRGVDLAVDQKADCLLIAGDLFDNERLSFETECFLIEQMERLNREGIPVYYAAGNHDPGLKSHIARIRWPGNVVVFADGKVHTELLTGPGGEIKAKIISCGHQTNREGGNLAALFPKAEGDVIHIGMLHTMVAGLSSAGSHEKYAPCSLADLITAGYDYWALGHVHQRQALDAQGRIQYPGNLQGRDPGETGEKGCLLVEIGKGSLPQISFCPLSSIQWHWLVLDGLGGISALDELLDYTVDKCLAFLGKSAASTGKADNMLRIQLSGQSPVYYKLNPEDVRELERQLSYRVPAIGIDVLWEDVEPPVDIDDYREGTHVLAEVLDLIDKAGADDDLLQQLMPAKLAAGRMNPSETTDYLRGLLLGLDREAVVRMVGEVKR